VIPVEAVVIFFAFVGAAGGAIIGQRAEHWLAARKFARDAARIKAAPYDWRVDGL